MECLTELHLDGTVINELHHLSIGHLTGLVLLNLRNCSELSSFPSEIGGLRSLKTLILNGCNKLDQIPLSLGKIESLEELDIGGTSLSDAPLAIGSLWNLKILNCERLQRNIWHSLNALFGGVWSIRDLNLSHCNLVDEDIPDDLCSFFLLEILDLSGNHFVWLSESLSQLVNLKALYLNDCVKLQQLPKLPASLQYVRGEKSFDMLQNYEGSSRSASSSSPPNPLLMTKVDDLSEEIAEKECSPQILHMSHSKLVASGKPLVGIEDQLEEVYNLLDLEESKAILFVGIFGIAGIGKTSIAEGVYHSIKDKFKSSCFLRISKESNLVSMQHQLLSQLLLKEIKIWDEDEDYGAQLIKSYVSGRKVLIVLDGVDEKMQLEKLVGSPDWFDSGSKVIITTRDRNVLHQPNYQGKMLEYNVKLLDHASALQIFCNHAFDGDYPNYTLKDLCNEIVERVGGVPLALRVIGSFLRDKDLAMWKETLMMLHKVEEDFFHTISQRSWTD